MRANELRIGNFATPKWASTDDYIELSPQDLYYFAGKVYKFKPIPLTEEWLVKLGFNKFQGIFVKTRKGGYQVIIDVTGTGKYKFVANEMNGITYIYHVHQLQNLYHSLTGEELTIKQVAI